MRIIFLLSLIFSLNAGDAKPASWEALPEQARLFVQQILERNLVLEPELDIEVAHQSFAALVADCQSAIAESGHNNNPVVTIQILNNKILTGREVNYLSNQYWRDSSFAAALLRKRGNCLATTTLYVAVARALDLPLHAVFVPEHAFVCWSDKKARVNIETTAQGAIVTDYTYISRFEINGQDIQYYGWMSPKTDDQLLAELDIVSAHHLAGQLHFAEAKKCLASALKNLPHRLDLVLLNLDWEAKISGDRKPLIEKAEAIKADNKSPRAAVMSALLTLAGEYRAHLDRAKERAALLEAYQMAPWHERDEILHTMSTCLRGLRDHNGAALCMELAVAHDPTNLWKRAWLAGMLSEANRHDEALTIIAKVREENPEEVYFMNMQAGMLVQAGKREEGRKLYDSIKPPRTGLEIYETNRAWFLAVWGDRDTFYPQFEYALSMAKDPSILSWIAEDDDLDKFRDEERFKQLVEACRVRLLEGAKINK